MVGNNNDFIYVDEKKIDVKWLQANRIELLLILWAKTLLRFGWKLLTEFPFPF